METHLLTRKSSLISKIPEIQKSLDMVEFLLAKQEASEPLETQFELAETLWATAQVPCTTSVNLWLGANVMLEYPIQEAQSLLSTKCKAAKVSLTQVKEDLEFLKEQITTMEVNMARVYNFDVKLKRSQK
jgi:prefoldin subunit 5